MGMRHVLVEISNMSEMEAVGWMANHAALYEGGTYVDCVIKPEKEFLWRRKSKREDSKFYVLVNCYSAFFVEILMLSNPKLKWYSLDDLHPSVVIYDSENYSFKFNREYCTLISTQDELNQYLEKQPIKFGVLINEEKRSANSIVVDIDDVFVRMIPDGNVLAWQAISKKSGEILDEEMVYGDLIPRFYALKISSDLDERFSINKKLAGVDTASEEYRQRVKKRAEARNNT